MTTDNLEKRLADAYNNAIHEAAENERLQKRYYDGYHDGLLRMKEKFLGVIEQMKENKE